MVPWLVLLAILGTRALLDDTELTSRRRRMTVLAATALVLVSLVMNAPGALFPASMDWNAYVEIDQHPERLWDWRHPPFLAWKQFARGPKS